MVAEEPRRPETTAPDAVAGGLAAPRARASFRALLANRNYRLYFFSALGSSLGDWAGLFALQILVAELAAGTRVALFSLAGVMIARLVPSVIFGPIAGVFADRYDRKRLMVGCDIARGALYLGIAFSGDIAALLALTFIVECLSLAFGAAKDATLPSLVHRSQLQEANQLNLLVTYGPLPFGALLPALVAGITDRGVRVVLLLNALSFLVSAGLMSRLRLTRRRARTEVEEEHTGFLAELREGLSFIAGLPLIRSLVLGVAGIFFGAGVVVSLGPVFVTAELDRAASDWSWVATSVGFGVALGIIAVRYITRYVEKAKFFPWGMAVTGACAAVIATLSSFPATLAFGAAMGVAVGSSFVVGYTLLHESTPDAVRARTFASFFTVTRVALFASLGLAPSLAGTIGFLTIRAGGGGVTLSGIRASILLGGLIGLAAAVSAGRGMYRAVREPSRHVITLPERPLPAGHEGVFIVFEGVEGSGKSTQAHALADTLRAEGRDVVVTREPGGPPLAERIRALLLEPSPEPMHPQTEALLYAAARVEHLNRVVLPALEEGKVVVSDRFLDSSLAYQGYGRELGIDEVLEVNRWAVDGVLPHVVVLLRLDVEEGLRRAAAREGGSHDRIESEELAFHRRVAQGYLDLVERYRGRFVVVDADADPDTVARRIRIALGAWLPPPPTRPPRPQSQGSEPPAAASRSAAPGRHTLFARRRPAATDGPRTP